MITSIGQGNSNNLSAFLKKIDNTRKQKENKNKENSNNNYADKIILIKKGQSGYSRSMDLDNDGEISLTEFNKYCEENGVSEKDKLKFLLAMQSSKMNSKIINENIKEKEENKKTEKIEDDNDNSGIYAKKGDDKYNEKMDYNKNGIITNAEYLQYLSEQKETNKNNQIEETEETTNTTEENKNEIDIYEPEVQSTVEYTI